MEDRASPPDKRSALTQRSLDRLLSSLHPERERAGEQYEAIRRKLVRFFEWRASPNPEEDADETIGRVARRLEQGEVVEHLPAYFYGVARLVQLEGDRERRRELAAGKAAAPPPWREETADPEAGLRCLEQCLARLPAPTRQLLLDYYEGDKSGRIQQRHQLAASYGIPMNALRIRVHRLRAAMEACVRACLAGPSR